MFSSKLAAVCLRYGSFSALAALSLLTSPLASAGTALTISGPPPTTATAGAAYSFQPTVSDPSGRTVTFKIYNRPSWASFSSSTGRLYGTPTAANVGAYHYVQIEGTDGITNSWLPAYTLTVSSSSSTSTGGGTTTGTKLVISGTPSATATVGAAYSFQPTTTVPSGQTATFKVYNKPSWASFSTSTGRLYGTPSAANVGTYRWVQIEALAGTSASWLPAYTLTVSGSTGTTSATGSATISWTPPTENTNGTALTNLAGYRIYYGTSQTNLSNVVNVTNPGLVTYVVSNLSTTTYYFAMTSINSSGTESARSAVVSHLVQ
ncbi:MAG TPA: putative Ig domain-containing protein [Steroidobacteraceae bacterium]|nr:putative Ig domain-containing protein [Steroidobacteraceae bacterium]